MAEDLTTTPDLGSDLFTLLKDGYSNDFAVVCEGGERVQVHRLILAARSAIFRTMVEVDMRERNTGTIEIKNFGAGVVKELINYIYSDRVTSDFTDLTELMRMAHQYEVYGLVKHCSDRLVQEVSVDNVVTMSTVAETLGVEELFGKCRAKISVEASSAGESVDQNGHYMANFFTNHIYPKITKEKSSICTYFTVNRASKLTGIGLYINGDKQISMDLSVLKYFSNFEDVNKQTQTKRILEMTIKITASDCSKPLKIVFPAPVKLDTTDHIRDEELSYKVQIIVGTECVNFKGDCSKSPLSLPMKSGELKVEVKSSFAQIPVLYFEE